MRPVTSAGDATIPRWGRRLLHWVLPQRCLGCGAPAWEEPPTLGLCDRCRETVSPWPQAVCRSCARPLPGTQSSDFRCGRCIRRPPPVDRLLCAWTYASPLDSVFTGLKFRRLDYLAEELGQELARRFAAETAECEAVVPVPLHWLRRCRRGFDQADLIAQAFAAESGLPLLRPLRRVRSTPPQSRLPRDSRQSNVRKAFAVRGDALDDRRRILLIDDVSTTGATMNAAAACLKAAGVAEVIALAAARTPEASP